MTEPIYTFKKGEGWVIQLFESFETYMSCGTHVRLERRTPNPGERATWNFEGEWSLEDWKHWAERNTIGSFIETTQSDKKNRDWMTVVRL